MDTNGVNFDLLEEFTPDDYMNWEEKQAKLRLMKTSKARHESNIKLSKTEVLVGINESETNGRKKTGLYMNDSRLYISLH